MEKEVAESAANDPLDPTLRVIAFILQEAAMQNDLLSGNLTLSRFHTLSPPKIPILTYLRYIRKQTKCPRACFVVALILLDKLLAKQTHVQITPNTVHKLILCSLMTASKFTTDMGFQNVAWAAIGGIRAEEMNILELEFLFQLQFGLVVTDIEYAKYDAEIESKSKLSPFQ